MLPRAFRRGSALAILVAAGVLCGAPAVVHAEGAHAGEARVDGEHLRRLSAELVILAADLRLYADPATAPDRRQGLADRMAGALAGLPWLIRLARAERPDIAPPPSGAVAALRGAWRDGRATDLAAGLDRLSARFPFDASALLPRGDDPARLARARALNNDLCAGCHDGSDPDGERPAIDLFKEGAAMPARDLAARLAVGVKGDRLTAKDNPLSDDQIAGLIALYRSGRP